MQTEGAPGSQLPGSNGPRVMDLSKVTTPIVIHEHNREDATSKDTVTDPVCGMQVDPSGTSNHVQHEGKDYYFCSARCLDRFVAEPAKYVKPSPRMPVVGAVAAQPCCCRPGIESP